MTAIHGDESFDGVEFDTPLGSFRAGRGGYRDGDDEFRSIRRKIRKRLAFARMLSTYVLVIGVLAVLELVFGWHSRILIAVAAVWGLVIGLRFLSIFVFDSLIGREAERRMVEREWRKRQGSG
ncbi:MAG: 2TM domain-containing protein [Chloroflexota bacterium]